MMIEEGMEAAKMVVNGFMISTMTTQEKMTTSVEDVGLIVVDLITTAVTGAVVVIGVITKGKFFVLYS